MGPPKKGGITIDSPTRPAETQRNDRCAEHQESQRGQGFHTRRSCRPMWHFAINAEEVRERGEPSHGGQNCEPCKRARCVRRRDNFRDRSTICTRRIGRPLQRNNPAPRARSGRDKACPERSLDDPSPAAHVTPESLTMRQKSTIRVGGPGCAGIAPGHPSATPTHQHQGTLSLVIPALRQGVRGQGEKSFPLPYDRRLFQGVQRQVFASPGAPFDATSRDEPVRRHLTGTVRRGE